MVGGAIIVAWIAGLAVLIRREYFRPQVERLAEAAKRVAPGVVYYGVMQGDRQVGFASSIIDTTGSSITVRDYLVADLPLGGKARRASARTNVTLSRALRMTSFDFELNTEGDADSGVRPHRGRQRSRARDRVGEGKAGHAAYSADRAHSASDDRAARPRALRTAEGRQALSCCRSSIRPRWRRLTWDSTCRRNRRSW